jgi:hypothetical protein
MNKPLQQKRLLTSLAMWCGSKPCVQHNTLSRENLQECIVFSVKKNEIYLKLYDKEANSIKKTSKAYTKTREQELFSMIEQGCEIDKDALYEKL